MIARWPAPEGQRGEFILPDELSDGQWTTLLRLQKRHNLGEEVTVIPGLGYVGIEVNGMFIGIEPCGHAHT